MNPPPPQSPTLHNTASRVYTIPNCLLYTPEKLVFWDLNIPNVTHLCIYTTLVSCDQIAWRIVGVALCCPADTYIPYPHGPCAQLAGSQPGNTDACCNLCWWDRLCRPIQALSPIPSPIFTSFKLTHQGLVRE